MLVQLFPPGSRAICREQFCPGSREVAHFESCENL
jgi:hypothetical protein